MILRARWWGGACSQDAILAVEDDLAIGGREVADQIGHANAQVHIGAVGNVLSQALGHLPGRQPVKGGGVRWPVRAGLVRVNLVRVNLVRVGRGRIAGRENGGHGRTS